MHETATKVKASDIPSRAAVERMAAGVSGASGYHRARAEVWGAIRQAYDKAYAAHGGTGWHATKGSKRRAANEITRALSDAIEWAQILDRSEPARRGSELEITDFRNRAIAAVKAARL